MGQNKHTPGPWRTDRVMSGSIFIRSGSGDYGRTVTIVSLTDTESETTHLYGMTETVSRTKPVKTAEADANLIASAPDLFSAANEAVDFLGGVDGAVEVRAKLLAAIAKAEGRSA